MQEIKAGDRPFEAAPEVLPYSVAEGAKTLPTSREARRKVVQTMDVP